MQEKSSPYPNLILILGEDLRCSSAVVLSWSHLLEPLLRHEPEHDGLHGGDVAEAHLGDVERAHHVRPAVGVGALQRAVPVRAQLAAHARRPLLGLALAAEPGTRGHAHDAVAGWK